MDLSVLIPARNEEWLAKTITDVLAHARAETEVIAVMDGDWIAPPVEDHPRVHIVKTGTPIGQRAATNLAARMSTAAYLLKLDAHCSVDEGFDAKLIQADKELGRPDVTQIAAMLNWHVFNWRCQACGHETYQGPKPATCESCKKADGFERVVVWQPRTRKFAWSTKPGEGGQVRTEFWRFDSDLHFQYDNQRRKRPESQGEIVDVMSSVGCTFFMRRERFFEIGGLDEGHGSWGQYGTEIACKSWLSGGRHVVNKRTWIGHLFRTQGAAFGFPYPMRSADQEHARQYSKRMWLENRWPGQVYPLSWLIEKFAPIEGWHTPADAERDPETTHDARKALREAREKRLSDVMAAGARFGQRRSAA